MKSKWVRYLYEEQFDSIRNNTRTKMYFEYRDINGNIKQSYCYYDKVTVNCNDADYIKYRPSSKKDWENVIGEPIIKFIK
jgi:hypothetical protein